MAAASHVASDQGGRPQSTEIITGTSRRRASAKAVSRWTDMVHPAQQHTNLHTVVEGPPIVVSAAHVKIRRDGYRRPRCQ
jgi:hypothetical protein